METIVFGGGCFWCMEAVFQMLRGVEKVTSGYAGGKMKNPTYEQVSSEITGHAEVVKVEFNQKIVKLEDLFAVFFTTHDPTTLNQQGNDIGTQYRSAIYFTSPSQEQAAKNFIKNLTEEKTFDRPIVTELKPLNSFYEAEEYHKNYYRNNADRGYCQLVINPKIVKLRKKFAHLLQS